MEHSLAAVVVTERLVAVAHRLGAERDGLRGSVGPAGEVAAFPDGVLGYKLIVLDESVGQVTYTKLLRQGGCGLYIFVVGHC